MAEQDNPSIATIYREFREAIHSATDIATARLIVAGAEAAEVIQMTRNVHEEHLRNLSELEEKAERARREGGPMG